MRLMPDKGQPRSEDEMQRQVCEYFSNRTFKNNNANDRYYNRRIIPKVYRETRIPQIGRISDIIIYITDRRIINIECKFIDYSGVIKQAIDHLRWADYSYVCFYADTYLPAYEIDRLLTNGIGLLLWREDIFVEVLQSGFNKKKDIKIHNEVISILKKREAFKTGVRELECQKELF